MYRTNTTFLYRHKEFIYGRVHGDSSTCNGGFFLLPVTDNHEYCKNGTPTNNFEMIDPLWYIHRFENKTKVAIYIPVFYAFVVESLLPKFFPNSILVEKHVKYLTPLWNNGLFLKGQIALVWNFNFLICKIPILIGLK